MKHGSGSINVWECFSWAGVRNFVRIDGIMKKKDYRKIFETNGIPSGLRLNGPGFIFMQDNDPNTLPNYAKVS